VPPGPAVGLYALRAPSLPGFAAMGQSRPSGDDPSRKEKRGLSSDHNLTTMGERAIPAIGALFG
jgi:hypothetical protein